MVVGHIEEFIFSCHYPQIPFVALAFRAMPVTAAVIADMQHFTVKIYIREFDVEKFKTTKSTAIQGSQQNAMFQKIRSFNKSFDLLLSEDYR